jgi:hypothetical protein
MLDDWSSITRRGRDFSLRHRVQTGSEAHQVSYPMGTTNSFPGIKRPGCEANHSPPTSVEFKNAWSYTSTLPHVFMSWYLIKHREASWLYGA